MYMLVLNESTLQYRHLCINCWLYVGTAISLQTVKAILLVLKLKQTFTPPPKKKKNLVSLCHCMKELEADS